MLRRIFGSGDHSSAQSAFTARRQDIIQELNYLGNTAVSNAECYAALSDYVIRFAAIRDEVNALARGSRSDTAQERHHEIETKMHFKREGSVAYKTACDSLEDITERLWHLNNEEFTPIADKSDTAPGPLIWGNIYDALASALQAVNTRRH